MEPVTTAIGAMSAGAVISSVDKALNTLDRVNKAKQHLNTSSLVDITSALRVEPLAIIDPDSMQTEYIGDVLKCAHNIFAGFYLQALSVLGDVGNINVIKILDKLNPNRKSDVSGFITEIMSSISSEGKAATESHNNAYNLSLESFKLPNYALEDKDDKKQDRTSRSEVVGDRALATAQELSNLSFGKLINATITSKGNSVKIPIAIRLLANVLPQDSMIKLLSMQGLDRSFTERYYKWRAGRISFIQDLILMRDIINEDKKAMMQDKSGIIEEIFKRAKNNKKAGLFSRNASMNEASNVLIFADDTANQLKLRHNLDIDNPRDRQSMFDGSYAMIMVKIDREYERFSFYTSKMNMGTSINKNELKNQSNKNSSQDLVEVFTALKKSDSTSLF